MELNLQALKDVERLSKSANPEDRKKALESSAKQFEALFIQQFLDEAQKSTEALSSGLFEKTPEMEKYKSFMNQQIAQNMANSGQGIGLAQQIIDSLHASGALKK